MLLNYSLSLLEDELDISPVIRISCHVIRCNKAYVSNVMSHCVGNVQMRKEWEAG